MKYIVENGEPREAQRGDEPTHALVPIQAIAYLFCRDCWCLTDPAFWIESDGLCGDCLAEHGFMAEVPG